MFPKRLLSIATTMIGWSPVGKDVLIKIDDAYDEILNNSQFRGKIITLTDIGNAVMELENSLSVKEGEIRSVVAVPRHQKYNFDYLWWGGVAVNLLNSIESDNSNVKKTGAWIAIASLKLAKLGEKRK